MYVVNLPYFFIATVLSHHVTAIRTNLPKISALSSECEGTHEIARTVVVE
jgi:hypothetical protein